MNYKALAPSLQKTLQKTLGSPKACLKKGNKAVTLALRDVAQW